MFVQSQGREYVLYLWCNLIHYSYVIIENNNIACECNKKGPMTLTIVSFWYLGVFVGNLRSAAILIDSITVSKGSKRLSCVMYAVNLSIQERKNDSALKIIIRFNVRSFGRLDCFIKYNIIGLIRLKYIWPAERVEFPHSSVNINDSFDSGFSKARQNVE